MRYKMNNIQRINAAFIGGLLTILYNSSIFLWSRPEIPSMANVNTTTVLILSSFLTGFIIVYFSILINDFFFGFLRRRIQNTIHTSVQEKRKADNPYQSNK